MARDKVFEIFHRVVANRWNPAAIADLVNVEPAPIAGFLDTGMPEEIAIAAGYWPILLTGDLDLAPDRVQQHLDVSAPARIRYLYEALVAGRHDAADVLCVTGGDRWIGETAGFFEVYREVFAAPDIQRMLYLERARGSFAEHREFNRSALARFAHELSDGAPRPITVESLWDAIELVNHTRALLREVETLRRAVSPQISGADAHAIVLSAMLMPKAVFNVLLEDALAERCSAPDSSGVPRVFLTGSAIDHPALIELVEGMGAVVVGEDSEFGMRYGHTPVLRNTADPFEALADRWTYKFPESWAFGRDRRIAQRVEMAAATAPDAVIALHIQGDTAYGWDFPDQAEALRARDIAVLALVDTDYSLADEAHLRARIGEFLADLPQRPHHITEETR